MEEKQMFRSNAHYQPLPGDAKFGSHNYQGMENNYNCTNKHYHIKSNVQTKHTCIGEASDF
jgi:hypothetical protein